MWLNVYEHNRIGNSLFARAHIYAAALEYDESVIDFGFIKFSHLFPNSKIKKLPIYPLDKNGKVKDYSRSLIINKFSLRLLHVIRPRYTGKIGNFWSSVLEQRQ